MIDGHNWIGWEKQKPTKWSPLVGVDMGLLS